MKARGRQTNKHGNKLKNPIPEGEIKYEIHTLAADYKRKRETSGSKQRKRRRVTSTRTVLSNAPHLAPVGPKWDSVDHSCAYDSLIFVLYWLWYSNSRRWGAIIGGFSNLGKELLSVFGAVTTDDIGNGLNTARDRWRDVLRDLYPGQYPPGEQGACILELSRRLWGGRVTVINENMVCDRCGGTSRLRNPSKQTLVHTICVVL